MKTIFFPASGYRLDDPDLSHNSSFGNVNGVLTYGAYWTAVPNDATRGLYLSFYGPKAATGSIMSVTPQAGERSRAWGLSVRPAQEE